MEINNFKEKVMGCWLGKAAGGTLGQPWEGSTGPLELTYYDPVPTTMIPNDDLDAQVVWACMLEKEWKGKVSRHLFAKAWSQYWDFPWDEYGVAFRNLRLGIKPPWTGIYDNWFNAGMGAAIRSEIWAGLAPGDPERAAKFAYEDACVDHCEDASTPNSSLLLLKAPPSRKSPSPN